MCGIAGYIGKANVEKTRVVETLDIQVSFADIRQATFVNEVFT